MDRQMILDYLVHDTQDKAAKHYRQKHFHMPGLYQALQRINDQREDKPALSALKNLPGEPDGAAEELQEIFGNDVSRISLVLAHRFPNRFFFYRASDLEDEIFEGLNFFSEVEDRFKLRFKRVGSGAGSFGRYLKLNEALLEFAGDRWPGQRKHQTHLMYLLYEGFGRLLRQTEWHQPYWLMATKEPYWHALNAGHDVTWSGGKDIRVGNHVFMYRTSPTAAITDIYKIKAGPRFIPWAGWGGFEVDMDKVCSLKKPIRFSEMKSDPDISQWFLVKRSMIDSRCVPVPPRVCNSLLARIPEDVRQKNGLLPVKEVDSGSLTGAAKSGDSPLSHPPTLATPDRAGLFSKEAEFEAKVIVPLLQRWGFRREAQHRIEFHTSGDDLIGRVDFRVNDHVGPLTLFEDKQQIVNDADLTQAVEQARTYALLLGLPSFVVASPEGMWLYRLYRDQETLVRQIPATMAQEQQEEAFKNTLLQLRQ